MESIKIPILKRKLRTLYIERSRILDSFSCGIEIARAVSPRLTTLERDIDSLLDRLSVLDPDNCPKTRMSDY